MYPILIELLLRLKRYILDEFYHLAGSLTNESINFYKYWFQIKFKRYVIHKIVIF